MQELIHQLYGHLRALWVYRWKIQLVAWPICLAGWFGTAQLPDQYETSARVFVDTRSILRPLLSGIAVQSNIEDEIAGITQTILNRNNLLEVLRATDLDIKLKNEADIENEVRRLKEKIKFYSVGRDNLYAISYIDKDPETAKNVVQSLLTIFVEKSLGGSRTDTSSAQQFLEKQIQEYETRLTEAENRLKEFRQKNVGLMPSDGVDYFGRLNATLQELERAKLQLSEAENRVTELRKQLSGEEPTFGLVQSATTPTVAPHHPNDERIQALKARLETLLLQFTDQHPEVVSIRATLKPLEEQRAKDLEQMSKKSAVSTNNLNINANPVYQQLKIALGNAEAEAASLRVRVREYQKRAEELRSAVDTVPKVEAELVQLNRDYNINRQNYEALLARRESAKISEQAEQSADELKFKIVEPPRAAIEPIGPKRLLLDVAVFIGAIGLGIGLAIILSQANPTFNTIAAARAFKGASFLGSVSMVLTPEQKASRRRELVIYSVSWAILFSLFSIVAATAVLKINFLQIIA